MQPPGAVIGAVPARSTSYSNEDSASPDQAENGRPAGRTSHSNGMGLAQRTKSFLSGLSETFPLKGDQSVSAHTATGIMSETTSELRKNSKEYQQRVFSKDRASDNTRATIFRQSTSGSGGIMGEKRMTVRDMEKMVFGPRNTTTRSYADVMPQWPRLRRYTFIFIESLIYKLFMASSIAFNMALLVLETDMRARHKELDDGTHFKAKTWMDVTAKALVGVYIADIAFRIYVDRKSFFKGIANMFDLTIVVTDFLLLFIQDDVPSVAVLRVFRIARVVRVLRSFLVFRELYLMMQGLVSAIRAIVFAAFLIFIGLTMWSILAVEFIHSKNVVLNDQNAYGDCIRCRVAFSTVMHSNLTFMKNIIAGDSWGLMSLPLMETHPETSFIIIAALLTIQLGLLNLIVAVIVDRAAAARADDEELQHTVKMEMLDKSYQRLINLFQAMDTDGSGALSLPELEESYDEHVEFREILNLMDIGRQDLALVFEILDQNRDEEVSYTEFVEQLHTMKTLEDHTLLIFIKHYVNQIHEKSDKQLDMLQSMTVLFRSQVEELMTVTQEMSALLPGEPGAREPGAQALESAAVGENDERTKHLGQRSALLRPQGGAEMSDSEHATHGGNGHSKGKPDTIAGHSLNGFGLGSSALQEMVTKLLLAHDEVLLGDLSREVDDSIRKVLSASADKVVAQLEAAQRSVPSQSDAIALSSIVPEIFEEKVAHDKEATKSARNDLCFSIDSDLVSPQMQICSIPVSRALHPPCSPDAVEILYGAGPKFPEPKSLARVENAERCAPRSLAGLSPSLVGPRFTEPEPSSRIQLYRGEEQNWVPLPMDLPASMHNGGSLAPIPGARPLRGPALGPELPKIYSTVVHEPSGYEAEPQQPAPVQAALPPPQPEGSWKETWKRGDPAGRAAAAKPDGQRLPLPPESTRAA